MVKNTGCFRKEYDNKSEECKFCEDQEKCKELQLINRR